MFWRLVVCLCLTHLIFEQGTSDDRFERYGICRKNQWRNCPYQALRGEVVLYKASFFL